MLDLVQLRAFLEVAERGTVVAAAATLGYTSPAVTQQVAKLERSLGATLFDRTGGRLRLNHAGAALVPVARDLLDLAGRAAEVVRRPEPRPRIVVGGVSSALAALVAPRLAELRARVDLAVIEREDADALRDLRLGHLDIALVQEYPGDDVRRDGRLAHTVGRRDPLRLVLPPSWPSDTTLAELRDVPWLVNGTGTRCESVTRALLAAGDLDPTVVGDVSDNHLLLTLVAAGHGATVVPDLVLAEASVDVTVSSTDLGLARSLVAVTRRSPSSAVAAVVELLIAR